MNPSPKPILTVKKAFFESFLHDRHTLLGRELQPFCLDHLLLLEALDSPLLLGGAVEIADLQIGCAVCSTSTVFEFYDATLRPSKAWRKWREDSKSVAPDKALADFNRYFDDYMPSFPSYRPEDSDETKCPAYFLAAAKWIDAGHDPVRVRRMPLGELIAWNLARAEAKGDSLKLLKSETEIAAQLEIAAEEMAEALKGTAPCPT